MTSISRRPTAIFAVTLCAAALPASLAAQEIDPATGNQSIYVEGFPPDDLTGLAAGPEFDGFISARRGDQMQVTGADGSITNVLIAPVTDIRARAAAFSALAGPRWAQTRCSTVCRCRSKRCNGARAWSPAGFVSAAAIWKPRR